MKYTKFLFVFSFIFVIGFLKLEAYTPGQQCYYEKSDGTSAHCDMESVTCPCSPEYETPGSCYVSWQNSQTGEMDGVGISLGETYGVSSPTYLDMSVGYSCTGDGVTTCNMIGQSYAGARLKAFSYSCDLGSVITGTINVTTNVAGSVWTITGPVSVTGSGLSQSLTSQPAGTYTITFDAVSGYITPASQSFTITNQGDVISFSGTYVAIPTVEVHFQ